ncbi:MAG: tol-pal system-associated acyl-CoA thioesterase [Acidiferrobacter sp.]
MSAAGSPPAGFAIEVRVYYGDTDAAGVVYYANYLRFMERARNEWLRARLGGPHELALKMGVLFAVRSVALEFRVPARLDDVLRVTADPLSIRGASLTFQQDCWRQAECVCTGKIDVVCVDSETFAPRRLPRELMKVLAEVSAS